VTEFRSSLRIYVLLYVLTAHSMLLSKHPSCVRVAWREFSFCRIMLNEELLRRGRWILWFCKRMKSQMHLKNF
jgi:hypothetical protein